MMTSDLVRRIKWNEPQKERVKIKAMDQLWPPQDSGMYSLVHCLFQFWQSLPQTVHADIVDNWKSDLLQLGSFQRDQRDVFSSVLSMKQVRPPSKDNHSLHGLSQYLRLLKGYQHISRNTTGTGVLQRKLRNNSDILKALETKDFGKIFYQLVAQLLVCASQSSKTGGKSGNTKHFFSGGHQSTSFKSAVPFTGQSSEQKIQSDKDLACCVAKIVAFLTVNRAICGRKTTSFPSDEQDNFSGLKSEDLQAILQLVITNELLKSHFQAFQKLFYWAISVQVLLGLLITVITIIDNCVKLQSEGDDKNNRSLEVNKKIIKPKNIEVLSSSIRFQSRDDSFQLATIPGQMYANHNGFGQGDMMDDYDMARFGNGGGDDNEDGEFVEDFAEIPDFGNFGDNENDEMMDDADNDEFERRFRAAYDDERALRRVPSVSALPPVDDFLNREDQSDYSNAGMLGGWANEAIIHHGDLGDILRQIAEDPIPLDPEPPHGLGQDLQVQLWLEEPLVFEQMLMEGSVANAA